MRVADRDDELADAQALRVAELGGDEVAAVDAQHRQVGQRVGADTSNSSSRPSTNDARPRPSVRATTCAEVSMKPSGVITTPLPPPSRMRPPRTRRDTRRFATEGESRSATVVTARE